MPSALSRQVRDFELQPYLISLSHEVNRLKLPYKPSMTFILLDLNFEWTRGKTTPAMKQFPRLVKDAGGGED